MAAVCRVHVCPGQRRAAWRSMRWLRSMGSCGWMVQLLVAGKWAAPQCRRGRQQARPQPCLPPLDARPPAVPPPPAGRAGREGARAAGGAAGAAGGAQEGGQGGESSGQAVAGASHPSRRMNHMNGRRHRPAHSYAQLPSVKQQRSHSLTRALPAEGASSWPAAVRRSGALRQLCSRLVQFCRARSSASTSQPTACWSVTLQASPVERLFI